MAETLGSLIDKLTINYLRQHHLKGMLKSPPRVGLRLSPQRGPTKSGKRQKKMKDFSSPVLKKKLRLVQLQRQDLVQEINDFFMAAVKGKLKLREEKLKLYNAPEDMGRIPKLSSLGEAISYLAQKNLELWYLEDEARRKDVNLAYIGKIKLKINRANQQRNDLIDALDELLEICLKKNRSASSS